MERVGRYEIKGEIGRGAMGVVWRAHDPVIGRTVAIKTIRLSDVTDPAERERSRERLFREAQSAGILSHPHIVTIYDIGQEGDVAYIAMEYVEGKSLDEAMRSGAALEPARLRRVLEETAEALDYAHGKGIVHRDIKPANILLDETGAVKITDFGVAKILSQQGTRTETVLGTPSYMPPEQIEGAALDGRSDQFALGVIAYELLTGERPFVGESIPNLLYRIVHEAPPRAHLLNASLREPVSLVLEQALAKSLSARYASCGRFVSRLFAELDRCEGWHGQPRGSASELRTQVLTQEASLSTDPGHRPESFRARRGRDRKNLWMPLVGVLLGLAVSVGYLALNSAGTPPAAVRPEPPSPKVVAPEAPPKPPVEKAKPEPPAQPPPEPKPVSPEKDTASTPTPSPPAAAKPAPPVNRPPAEPASALVDITSTPPGARVAIDDTREYCVTPCQMELSRGRHVLYFTLANHRPGRFVINVPEETQASVRLQLATGTLVVRTTPGDATIVLNGEVQSRRTPAIFSLPVGRYRLQLQKAGYPYHEQEVEIADSATRTVELSWN